MKFRSILAALIAAILVALVPSTSFAQPDNAKKLGTGYFTVGTATIPAAGGCFYHPMRADVNIGYETDGWFLSVQVAGPKGYVDSWVSEVYFDDWGASYFQEDIFICSTLHGPGTYTITGEINTVDNGGSTVLKSPMTPATFLVNPAPVVTPIPTPTPTPPPAPPVVVTPPAPVLSDVTGNVSKKFIERGVQFTFKSKAIPAGTTVGNKLQWSIVSGDKIKSFQQGPSAASKKSLKFPKGSGVHKVKVLRNGKVAMRVTVKA